MRPMARSAALPAVDQTLVRRILVPLGLLLSLLVARPALADDPIFFRNLSPVPVRVAVFSDEGRYRGARTVGPGETRRIMNGKGKTRISVEGRTFRVRDIGYHDDDRWFVSWGRGARGGLPPVPPELLYPRRR